jgi:hypothetical protein
VRTYPSFSKRGDQFAAAAKIPLPRAATLPGFTPTFTNVPVDAAGPKHWTLELIVPRLLDSVHLSEKRRLLLHGDFADLIPISRELLLIGQKERSSGTPAMLPISSKVNWKDSSPRC